MEEYGTDFSYTDINSKLYSCFSKCFEVSQDLKNNDAKEHLLYGVCRRVQMVQANYERINEIASFDRKEPLKKEERLELNIHLNSLYVHIFGMLDNLAWAFCHETKILGELKLDESNGKVRKRVGLFAHGFGKIIAEQFNDLAQVLNDSSAWFKDLKNLRDPIAHRIPLYAVPAILSETEAPQYQDKHVEAVEALNNIDLDKSGALFDELGQMGTYVPVFYHQQQEQSSSVNIIIQIEQDLYNFNRLAIAVFDSLLATQVE